MVWEAKSHDTGVLGDERFVDAEQAELICDPRYIILRFSVVVAMEPDNLGDAQVVVE